MLPPVRMCKMRTVHVVLLMSVLAFVSGCASPTTPSSQSSVPTPVTPPAPVTPPTAVIHNSINTVLSGVIAGFNGMRNGSKGLRDVMAPPSLIRPSFTQQCNAAGTSCSIQFNESFNPAPSICTGGGSSTASGTLTGVIQGSPNSISGTLNYAERAVFNDCSENGWVSNTTPSFATNGQVFITSQHVRLNLTMSGAFVVTNAPGTPNGRASCVTNGVILQWDDITGNWANSGSIDCTPGGAFRF